MWRAVQDCVSEIRPRLIVLDTLADLFAGEENQRAQARQFISMLRGLALTNDLCIVLLGYPSLEGLKSGSGTSGSTGWNNSVRSRLYFERVFTSEGNKVIEQDEDVRELSVKKVNYGRKGEPIRVKWVDGVFERQAGTTFGLDATQRNAVADDAFLTLLRWHERHGQPVSPNASSLYAPRVFASHYRLQGQDAGGATRVDRRKQGNAPQTRVIGQQPTSVIDRADRPPPRFAGDCARQNDMKTVLPVVASDSAECWQLQPRMPKEGSLGATPWGYTRSPRCAEEPDLRGFLEAVLLWRRGWNSRPLLHRERYVKDGSLGPPRTSHELSRKVGRSLVAA